MNARLGGVGQARGSRPDFGSAAARSRGTVDAVSRRTAISLISAGVLAGLGACSRRAAGDGGSVVLYSSVDDEYLRLVVRAFEKSTGFRVLVKGDTEATKTTGLVERIRAEHAAGKPGADVWWSSEPFLTIALADEGVFVPMTEEVFGDLPTEWRGGGTLWGAFANRARVVVRNPAGSEIGDDFMSPAFTRRGPAIARPQFGSTRGHFGQILATTGEDCFVSWLRALRAGGVRIVDGNSAVVRMVASGEAPCGLTDTDDVWAGQRLGWAVECEAACSGFGCTSGGAPGSGSGPPQMPIPNTVALVKGGANPAGAAALARYLLSAETERRLMESDSHNMPVRTELIDEMRSGPLRKFVVEPGPRREVAADGLVEAPSLRQIADAAPRAVELARREGIA